MHLITDIAFRMLFTSILIVGVTLAWDRAQGENEVSNIVGGLGVLGVLLSALAIIWTI